MTERECKKVETMYSSGQDFVAHLIILVSCVPSLFASVTALQTYHPLMHEERVM